MNMIGYMYVDLAFGLRYGFRGGAKLLLQDGYLLGGDIECSPHVAVAAFSNECQLLVGPTSDIVEMCLPYTDDVAPAGHQGPTNS
jgi:hypothetical protein